MNQHTYTITGMTCQGCVAQVQTALAAVSAVTQAEVSLAQQQVTITSAQAIALSELQAQLPSKYKLLPSEPLSVGPKEGPSKWRQLRPLGLIFLFLLGAAVLITVVHQGTLWSGMRHFMGLFFCGL